MDINIVRYIFIFNAVYTGGLGLLINYIESYLPTSLTRAYRYGKFSTKSHGTVSVRWEVPKRWFRHFYIFAGPMSTIILCIVLLKYVYNRNVPEIVFTLLDALLGASRKPLVSPVNVILTIVVFNIQCWKRVYETCCISVFSKQKMNITHYLVGFVHYFGVLLCIIGESEGFVKGSTSRLSWYKLTTTELICASVFLWSSYMQFRVNLILARLRKTKHGAVVSYDYKIPCDGLFKYISNPLQFTEILMYLMSSMILWQASTYHYVTVWVITNQVESAFLSHQWYYNTFQDYPKERKILIPYVW